MYVCMYVCLYVYIHIHVCIDYIDIHACLHIYLAHKYVCICTSFGVCVYMCSCSSMFLIMIRILYMHGMCVYLHTHASV